MLGMFRNYFPSELGGIFGMWALWHGGATSCSFYPGVTEISWQETNRDCRARSENASPRTATAAQGNKQQAGPGD